MEQEKEEVKGDYHHQAITDNFLCIVGIQNHMVEKDLIKLLRQSLSALPLKGVQKKRNQSFGFLQFSDRE